MIRPGLLIALTVFALDQLSKWWLLTIVDIDARPAMTLAPFLDLVMVWNYGVSFGLFAKQGPLQAFLLIVLALAIVAGLLIWLEKSRSLLLAASIGMVIGGALGNVLDRARFGAVADFFSFHIGPYYWPAFNVADAAICIGVALLCLESMLADRKNHP